MAVGPSNYSPAMCAELLRICLKIDADERIVVARAVVPARFKLVDSDQLLAIDAQWSLHGMHRSWTALPIYDDVYERGHRFPVPQVPTMPVPRAQRLYMGRGWEEGEARMCTGLCDVMQAPASSAPDPAARTRSARRDASRAAIAALVLQGDLFGWQMELAARSEPAPLRAAA